MVYRSKNSFSLYGLAYNASFSTTLDILR